MATHAADVPAGIHVRGKAVDDATGKPIPVFKARAIVLKAGQEAHPTGPTTRRTLNNGTVNDNTPLTVLRKGTNGTYDIALPEAGDFYIVEIEADGYTLAGSSALMPKENVVEFDARLRKGAAFAGQLLQPDGKPAAGAQLIFRHGKEMPGILNGRLRENVMADEITVIRSDAEGRYHAAERLPASAAVIHSSGWGEVRAEKEGAPATVTLKQWAVVEGQLLQNGNPLARQLVWMHSIRPRSGAAVDGSNTKAWLDNYFINTDGQGRYKFDRVIDGGMELRVNFTNPETSGWAGNFSADFDLRPGEHRVVNMGDTGRPVTGRLVLADTPGGVKKMPTDVTMRLVRPKMTQPGNWDTLSAGEKAELTAAFYESAAFKAYLARPQSYAVAVNADGTFRAADVPAGNYLLDINLPQLMQEPSYFSTMVIAARNVIVPEIPGGRSNEPLEIGSVELRSLVRPKAGDAAPAYEMATYDGRRVSLADLKGHYVLMDFWATWSERCIAQVPHLAELQKSLAADPRFVMLSVSVDDRIDEPRNYLKTHPMPWRQGWNEALDMSPARLAFVVGNVPSLWLIGPDGRILMRPTENATEDVWEVLGANGSIEKKPQTNENLDAIVKSFLAGK